MDARATPRPDSGCTPQPDAGGYPHAITAPRTKCKLHSACNTGPPALGATGRQSWKGMPGLPYPTQARMQCKAAHGKPARCMHSGAESDAILVSNTSSIHEQHCTKPSPCSTVPSLRAGPGASARLRPADSPTALCCTHDKNPNRPQSLPPLVAPISTP